MTRQKKLILEQLDRKLKPLLVWSYTGMPNRGWIYAIRKALNISLRQLGEKTGNIPQGIKAMENREKLGTITLKSLQEVAQAMDMKLVYGFVPKDGSLEELINRKALEKAKEIVVRTSQNMKLEDQENPSERIKKAIDEKKNELITEMPKYLWD
jgi:predicted DNA-binding mobile mystery protein A